MKTTLLAIGALVFLSCFVRAEDWTVKGKTYANVTVTKVDGDTVHIMYSGGIGSVNMADIPVDAQKKLGHDPDKIAADAKAQQDAAAATEKDAQDRIKAQQDAVTAGEAAFKASLPDLLIKENDTAKTAKTAYDSADKASVNGQVFIATKGGENVKLSLVHVNLFSEAQAVEAMTPYKARLEQAMKQLQSVMDAQKADYLKKKAALDAHPDDGTAVWLALGQTAKDSLDQYQVLVAKYYSYASQSFFISGLPTPLAESTSDADGKFSIQVPKTGAWVLEAEGSRSVGDKTESYFWLARISQNAVTQNNVFLSNENLSTTESPDSIVKTVSIALTSLAISFSSFLVVLDISEN